MTIIPINGYQRPLAIHENPCIAIYLICGRRILPRSSLGLCPKACQIINIMSFSFISFCMFCSMGFCFCNTSEKCSKNCPIFLMRSADAKRYPWKPLGISIHTSFRGSLFWSHCLNLSSRGLCPASDIDEHFVKRKIKSSGSPYYVSN